MKPTRILDLVLAALLLTFTQISFAQDCEENSIYVVLATGQWGEEVSWEINDAAGIIVAGGAGYESNSAYVDSLCVPNGCYTVTMFDSFGDGWNGGLITVVTDDMVLGIGELLEGTMGSFDFGIGDASCETEITLGCTDSLACVYDSTADFDDGSCSYGGCNDSTALNYNSEAGCDDGSCEFPQPCDASAVIIWMYDSFGDGWNGAAYVVSNDASEVVGEGTLEDPDSGYNELCLADGCYSIAVGGGAFDSEISWEIVMGDQVLSSGGAPFIGGFGVNAEGCELTGGCTDSAACEYNADADYDDGSCVYGGCNDSTALNYNSEAGCDDGSCEYPAPCDLNMVLVNMYDSFGDGWNGSTYVITNGDDEVVAEGGLDTGSMGIQDICLDDGCFTIVVGGGIWEEEIYWELILGDALLSSGGAPFIGGFGINAEGCELTGGCTDSAACEYNADADYDDGSCVYGGCNDSTALNYNSEAGCDDGSCEYPAPCDLNMVLVNMYDSFGDGWNGSTYVITNGDDEVVAEGGLDTGSMGIQDICLDDGCFTIVVGGGIWEEEIYWELILGDALLSSGGAPFIGGFGINAEGCDFTVGCTDSAACEYDSSADVDDGSCTYPGCTDSAALNYNPAAGCDDGSCDFCENGIQTTLYVCTLTDGFEMEMEIVDENGELVIGLYDLPEMQVLYFDICLQEDMCYTVNMWNNTDEGWTGGYYWVQVDGETVSTDFLNDNLDFEQVNFSLDGNSCPTLGCTDTTAVNYDSTADMDDGTCIYPPDCDLTLVTLNTSADLWPEEISWVISTEDGEAVADSDDFSGGGSFIQFACLADGCYTVNMMDSFGDGWNGGTLTAEWTGMSQTFSLESGSTGVDYFGVNAEACAPVYGCTDPEACNYNEEASDEDDSCTYPGCNDSAALNYDSTAGCDDGSCEYPVPCDMTQVTLTTSTELWPEEISWSITSSDGIVAESIDYSSGGVFVTAVCLADGCYTVNMMDSFGDGWNGGVLTATWGDNTQSYTIEVGNEGTDYLGINTDDCGPVLGCTDAEACEYNADATEDDGSCTYPGCTDSTALNYDSEAGCDDDSCEYPVPCDGNEVTMWINTQGFPGEVSWDLIDDAGNVVGEGSGYTGGDAYHDLCLEDGCYTLNMYDSFGDGWNGGFYMMYDGDGLISDGSLFYGSWQLDVISINSDCDTDGCTDPAALNYDASADVDDNSCVYGGGNVIGGGGSQFTLDTGFVLTVSPNPIALAGKMTFANVNDESCIAIKVMDLSGRIVYQEIVAVSGPTMTVELDASSLAAGNYIVHAQNGLQTAAVQMIKMN